MDDTVAYLADKAWGLYKRLEPSQRLLIAVAGIPGSGKTTLAASVANKVNARYQQSSSKPDDVALVIPLDGYHLTRKQLSLMPNSEEAHFRRGAAFTFDGEGYLALVKALREPLGSGKTVHAPSFDHAVKDPVENDIPIPPSAESSSSRGSMSRSLGRLAEARVAKRNFAAGLSPSLEAALSRTKKNDMRNAEDVLENRVGGGLIREVIGSVEDDAWKSEGLKRVEKDLEDDRHRGDQSDQVTDKPPMVGERGRMDSIAELVAAGAGM
ncbi:putative uridine kinase [Cyphellophora attinorum]|uniref:Putative uridine kinase n=1 Tax=Cyphellophora attinorum TaxID=1664694 RepID=A0A0N1NXA5_9EURO|nr:putative uridine kinase [Phialophora attinorum]KPI37023.1 putative uridine kinase [Phialophora attinorum]